MRYLLTVEPDGSEYVNCYSEDEIKEIFLARDRRTLNKGNSIFHRGCTFIDMSLAARSAMQLAS